MSDEQEYLGEAYLDTGKKCMKMEGTFSLDVYLILTEVCKERKIKIALGQLVFLVARY